MSKADIVLLLTFKLLLLLLWHIKPFIGRQAPAHHSSLFPTHHVHTEITPNSQINTASPSFCALLNVFIPVLTIFLFLKSFFLCWMFLLPSTSLWLISTHASWTQLQSPHSLNPILPFPLCTPANPILKVLNPSHFENIPLNTSCSSLPIVGTTIFDTRPLCNWIDLLGPGSALIQLLLFLYPNLCQRQHTIDPQ